MENNKTQSQSKIIIEVQPKEGRINPTTGKPCDGSISIQVKAVLSESDRVMDALRNNKKGENQ